MRFNHLIGLEIIWGLFLWLSIGIATLAPSRSRLERVGLTLTGVCIAALMSAMAYAAFQLLST